MMDIGTVYTCVCTQTARWIDSYTKQKGNKCFGPQRFGGGRDSVPFKAGRSSNHARHRFARWHGHHTHSHSRSASVDGAETPRPHVVGGTRVHAGFGKSLKTSDTALPHGPEGAQLRPSPRKLKTRVPIKIYADVDSIIITHHYHYYGYYSESQKVGGPSVHRPTNRRRDRGPSARRVLLTDAAAETTPGRALFREISRVQMTPGNEPVSTKVETRQIHVGKIRGVTGSVGRAVTADRHSRPANASVNRAAS